MTIIRWILVGIGSILSGYLLVRYLIIPPISMAWSLVWLLLSLAFVVAVISQYFHGAEILLGLALALVGFSGSYLITNHLFLTQEEVRNLPEIQPRGSAEGHTAVVYLTHGEPPAYSSMPWIETFKELDHDKVPFIPTPFRPFFFHQLRNEYLTAGGSPHNYIHQDMLNSLEQRFREAGDEDTRFYLAFLDSNPRPDEAVIRAINDGASRVIVANVFLTISSHTQAGADMVDEIHVEDYGVELCKAAPLWDSDALKQMFVRRANKYLAGADKSKVGVLLVGHGQPAEWDVIYPTQTEQENLFRQEVMELLVQDGYRRENISLAWMEFKEPNITDITRRFAQQGVEKIFVFAASISATSIHSQYDIPEAVHAAKLPESIEVVNLGAWDNDPLVIQAIYEKVRGCGQ